MEAKVCVSVCVCVLHKEGKRIGSVTNRLFSRSRGAKPRKLTGPATTATWGGGRNKKGVLLQGRKFDFPPTVATYFTCIYLKVFLPIVYFSLLYVKYAKYAYFMFLVQVSLS